MSHAESSVRRPRPHATDEGGDHRPVFAVVVAGLAAALIFSRFFLPAESAAQGDTLWIVAAWMILGTIAGVGMLLRWFPAPRIDRMDFAVALWMGGQIVSSIVVVCSSGDKRSATNLAWEWAGLLVIWLVVRHGMVDRSIRQAILRALVLTGTLLAGLGMYQHYVSHPQMVAEYAPLFDKLHTATGAELAAVKQKLMRDGIPTEGAAAILFEKRLRDSREPLALFALANTFGGFLAVSLVLLLGEVIALWHRGGRWKLMLPLILVAGVIGWCLLLTKSRTACIGAACGILTLLSPWFRNNRQFRLFLLPIGYAVVAGTAVVGLLLAIGSLDHQVLSEAPKSLSYRLQYWQATSRMIAAHPWFGVGPGNFRQFYLQSKLPEASEEIADPHNMFFEMAATGGVFSLAGLLLVLWLGLMRYRGDSQISRESEKTVDAPQDGSPVVFWLAGAGPVLAFFGLLLCWGEWEDRLIILTLVWFALGGLLAVCWPRRTKSSVALNFDQSDIVRAAAVVLVVHLLGAGGISMPAITQLLVLLLAWSSGTAASDPATTPSAARSHLGTRIVGGVLAITAAILLVGVSVTALFPVTQCRHLTAQGVAMSVSRISQNAEEPERYFRWATVADPWSTEPWRHLFEQAATDGIRSNESFETAVEHLHEVMRRDPHNFWGPRTLGRFSFQRWQVSHRPDDCQLAVNWLRRALVLYPTNSEIEGELAIALNAAGDRSAARLAAQGALAQDAIYHKQGHVDRYLSPELRQLISPLAEAEAP